MSGTDSMVTLQERLVNLINQLNMPILETSLVISRWTNRLLTQLKEHTNELPRNLSEPWPLDSEPVESSASFDLEKALSLVDRDRERKIFDEQQIEQWTNNIANLILLSKRKNSAASNKDFKDKKEKYFNDRISELPRSIRIFNYKPVFASIYNVYTLINTNNR